MGARDGGRDPAGGIDPAKLERVIRSWQVDDPRRLLGRGHPVGDFLAADRWEVLERAPGRLLLRCDLPEQVRNLRGELFGGFAPTYVDLVALHTIREGIPPESPRTPLVTADLRVDFFEPVRGPSFRIRSEVLHRGGRTWHVQTRFLSEPDEDLLAQALTTLLEVRG